MANIDQLISDVVRREGGFVDHPADRGGPTKFGITQATLSEHLGREASRDEVNSLSESVAREIFGRNFFYRPRLDQLPLPIQAFCFDCAVNHGPRQAIRFVQQLCNDIGYRPPLATDGIIGPKTRRAASLAITLMGKRFLDALLTQRENYYHAICAADPTQQVFLNGWLNRLDEFRESDDAQLA